MTLTNGASSGNAGVNPGGAFGFDAANLSASANMQILLQTNNDLILSIYKTIVDSTQEINRKIVRVYFYIYNFRIRSFKLELLFYVLVVIHFCARSHD